LPEMQGVRIGRIRSGKMILPLDRTSKQKWQR
jgi:hypothetical protein